MSDSEAATTTALSPVSPKKSAKSKAGSGAKKQRAKPSHPKTSDMVNAAIEDLKERGGSSLQAIKKYITVNYKVDAEKLAPFIKKYLKSGVTTGSLVQTKGKGASGSFKLAGASAGEKKPAAKPAKTKSPKPKSSPKAKKTKAVVAAKTPPSPKKSPVKKSTETVTKAALKSKPASPSKTKTAAKSPTKKPKAPKPKKTSPAKAKPAAKKAASKKK